MVSFFFLIITNPISSFIVDLFIFSVSSEVSFGSLYIYIFRILKSFLVEIQLIYNIVY